MRLLACVVVLLFGPPAALAADEARRSEPPAAAAYEAPAAVERPAVEAPLPAGELGADDRGNEPAEPTRERKAGGTGVERSNQAPQEPLFLLLLQILRAPK